MIKALFYNLNYSYKKDYPDYYEAIKNPIDLKMIAKKIKADSYATLKAMETDLNLLVENAKRYNDPKSMLYKDAQKLKKLVTEKAKELNAALRQGQPWSSTSTRDKKLKFIEEIAESSPDEITRMINKQLEVTAIQQVKVEEPEPEAEEEEIEEEDEDDEEDVEDDADDVEEEEDEVDVATAGQKKPRKKRTTATNDESVNDSPTQRIRIKNNPLLVAMWQLVDHIKDYQRKGLNIIEPFLKLPSKRVYPDYYQDIKKPIALTTIKLKLTKRMYPTFQVC
jgi:protein polybromo-1